METSPGISRRGMLGGAAALGAVGISDALAAGPAAAAPSGGPGGPGGRPEEFVVRNAYVMSMDPAIGDVPGGDVYVRDGVIVAVGKDLKARGTVLDGRGTIVMPGLVETHWHMWTTLYRSLASSSAANAYFALNVRNGTALLPQDTYRGVRLALADAATSGITTVHDWSHNLRSPEYADANLRAHARSGLRGRFSYGTPQGRPADQTIDLADLRRVNDEWFRAGRVPLMHLGLAGRPPGVATDAVFRAEYDAARALGLSVSYHANSNRAQGALANIQKLGDAGALGPHTQIIHALFTTEAERGLLASSGASVSSSPWSELLIGYGVPPIKQLLDANVLLNLSVDTVPLTGTADMFSVIRVALGLHRGQAESEFSVSARRMIQAATIDGARGLGLGDVTGSLTPGKRADLVMVRTDDVTIAPFTDPANMIATATGAEHVDTVVVDGRFVKRNGRLTSVDTRQVVRDAQQSLEALLKRAG